tara:strand:+ start:6590 stop:7108 length:519 start_codon:yes stop_codon:yes gene_type:complete
MSARSIFTNSGVSTYTIDGNLGASANGLPMCYNLANNQVGPTTGGRVGSSVTESSFTLSSDTGQGDFASVVAHVAIVALDDGRKMVTIVVMPPAQLTTTGTVNSFNGSFTAAVPPGELVDVYCGSVMLKLAGTPAACVVNVNGSLLTVEPLAALGAGALDLSGFTVSYVSRV